MNDNTVLNEKDYAANGKTWIELAKKWGHFPDTEHISYHWTEDGERNMLTATVREIKARAFDSIMARIPNHKTKRETVGVLYGLRSRCLPTAPNSFCIDDFDKIEAFYKFLIEITE